MNSTRRKVKKKDKYEYLQLINIYMCHVDIKQSIQPLILDYEMVDFYWIG